jgi:hypothetical protein
VRVFSRRDGWRGTVLVYLIYRLDALLQHFYRIREVTDDPNCLLRLAIKQAVTPLRLSDAPGLCPPVGELHRPEILRHRQRTSIGLATRMRLCTGRSEC